MRRAAMVAMVTAMLGAGSAAHADDIDFQPWSTARGFSATFGSMPRDGVALSGITLEYAKRRGTLMLRGEYTYGLLTREQEQDDPNGIVHRGEVSLRVPFAGVGPRYGDLYKPGTFFVEAGIGHHWMRWRDGTADSGLDATISLGLMLSGGGARSLIGASKVKLLVAHAGDGPDIICSTNGATGCSAGGDRGYDIGIMATWGISLGD